MFLRRITDTNDLRAGLLTALDNEIFTPSWSRRQWSDEIGNPVNYVYLIYADPDEDYLAGFLSIGLAGDTIELKKIGILPVFRRQSLAAEAIHSMIEEYRSKGYENIIAEVAITNVTALTFYEKLGFYKISRRKKYYQNRIDALVLQKEL